MPEYEVREKGGRRGVVYRYTNDTPIDFRAWPLADFDHVELPPPPAPIDPVILAAIITLTVRERDGIVSTLRRIANILENADVVDKLQSEVDAKDPEK